MSRFLLALIFAAPLLAQTDTASLSGSVLDPSNAPVPNATVQVESLDTGFRRNFTTGGSGAYSFTALPIGHYQLTVNAPGFQTTTYEKLELQVGQSRSVDAHIAVASAASAVSVETDAAPLDENSASVGGVVGGTQLRELPLNGRNWSSLMSLTPGAIDTGTNNQRSVRFAGRALDDNNFRFDGVDATGVLNQAQKGNIRLQFSTEAIAEFRANAALYTAESGGTEGGQVDVVSRTGTNTYHGSLFEYLRNDALDARGPFDGRNLPPFRLNQFGGSFGLPVRKDRDFLFATFEGLRQRVGQTLIGFVPSDAFRAQVLAKSPGLSSFISAYPTGGIATADPNVNRLATGGRQVSDENSGLFRYDHRFSDRMLLYARYNVDSAVADVPNGALVDRTATTLATHNAIINLETVFSPRSLNEFKVGFNRANFFTGNESTLGVSVITPQFSQLYNNTGKVQAANTYSLLDTYSLTLGRHAVKLGFEARRVQINSTATSAPDYGFTFASTNDLLNNVLSQASLVDTLPTTGFRRREFYAFGQDEFRITPTLTANLGLRYEFFGVPSEVKNRGIVFDPLSCAGGYCPSGTSFYEPDYNNFSPRISLAWAPASLHNRTVIRTGYGVYYGDGQLGDINAPVDNLAGRVLLTSKNTPGLTYPVIPFLTGAARIPSTPRGLDRYRRTPYTQDWGFSVQQSFAGAAFTAGYLGTKGTKQFTRTYLNSPDPATGAVLLPQFGLIDYKTTSSNSNFHGLTISVQRNVSQALIVSANYLWSHSINDGAVGGGEAIYPENVRCRACERASSDQDIRHFLTSSVIYQLPFGQGGRMLSGTGMLSRFLGGWEWSNLFVARTGRPVNVTLARAAGTIPDANTSSPQRPNATGISPILDNPTIVQYLNSAAFAVPAAGTFGNLGRNVGRGPNLWQLDTSLSKRFALTEKLRLNLRAEAFNVFNRPQFGDPSGNFSSPVSFGTITTTVNTTGIGTGTPREIQFALRLEF